MEGQIHLPDLGSISNLNCFPCQKEGGKMEENGGELKENGGR